MSICQTSLSLQRGVFGRAGHQGDLCTEISKPCNVMKQERDRTKGTQGRMVACLPCHRGLAPRMGRHALG